MTRPVKRYLQGADATEAIGAALAAVLPVTLVVYLRGDLGAGKTTFVRGLLRGAGHRGPVRSPTYTLVEPYELPRRTIYHLDLYRLGDPEELEYLGIRDLVGPESVLLVEWAERGAGFLPEPDLEVRLEYRGAGRDVMINPLSPEGEIILDAWGRDHASV